MFFSFVVLIPAIFFIIFFGEKWRGIWLRYREKDEEDFAVSDSEVYRESQNPLWSYVLLLAICLCMLAGSAERLLASPPDVPLIYTMLFACGITLAIGVIFGFFVEVCNEKLVVRMGALRLKVLTVPLEEIQSAEIVTFRPILDFGGLGIRYGKGNTWAYFMSGTQGVQIVTSKNKKYIIGSDTPNKLLKVVQVKCRLEPREG